MLQNQGTSARRASLFLIAIAALLSWLTDTPRGQEPQVFRSQSNLVVLHVGVLNGKAGAVPNLPRDAFRVTEDGIPQTVTFFSNEDLPVAVGLLIDNSSSMLTRQKMVIAGTQAFAQSSHGDDQVFTILFNEHVTPGLPGGLPFTQSPGMVQSSLQRHPPGGRTAIHDAVIAGLDHVAKATHQKQVLIVLTDGEDNASRLSEKDMFARAALSSAVIYTISTADLDTGVGNHRMLRRLSDGTGGATYRPRTEHDVITSFGEIAATIRRGYSLGYVPTNDASDGRYRKVSVSVQGAGKLRVRARDGYVATSSTQAD